MIKVYYKAKLRFLKSYISNIVIVFYVKLVVRKFYKNNPLIVFFI